jgi:hypothetical protein
MPAACHILHNSSSQLIWATERWKVETGKPEVEALAPREQESSFRGRNRMWSEAFRT